MAMNGARQKITDDEPEARGDSCMQMSVRFYLSLESIRTGSAHNKYRFNGVN